MTRKLLCLAALLLCAVVDGKKTFKSKSRGSSDDDYCYDEERRINVRTSDCPHNCCVSGDCGSSDECRTALIIGLVIVGCIVLCCCICIIIGFMFWQKKGCFASKPSKQSSAPPAGDSYGYPGVQPQQGYPYNPQASLYPADTGTSYDNSNYAYPPPQQHHYPQEQFGGYPPPPHKV
eukprot:TRINITY_DN518_c9_g1_i1.p1 TRINITY_DN518_c9_g1~~TRINITY_DN518_c9_g1_i1.p1  ORF type:complete len:199 (+),score=23.94 TRINITY_DN518_c9_g1_i1:68-598(+)